VAVYIALLRGINVGKAKRVSMADLRSIVADELGIEAGDVATVLVSGNVVFRKGGRASTASLARTLEAGIESRLGMDVRVFVLTEAEVRKAVEANPFAREAKQAANRLGIAFHESKVDRSALKHLTSADWSPEKFAIGSSGTVTYAWHPNGVTGSPLAEAGLKVRGPTQTSRNLATLQKVLAKAQSL
jgi:uncharacterized protein (DUF1697 family)